ncbi:MAG TPA: amidase family protein [Caulobacteraceae bacterium]|nr:amidase family protein [Caulobacteraceae bacterium]
MTIEAPADLAKATVAESRRLLAAREVSALELTDAAIERIERLDPPINAVVVRDFDRARKAAKAADAAIAGGERRPLLGVPMTVKEAHNVEGLPTTWGVEAWKGWIAPEDSVGVKRLKAAGAIIVGKTNVPPHLSDWQSVNPIYGRTNNPFDPARTPGGSSGGSAAAVASGMVPLEFGSDIGGSIRVPSAFCGIAGHKPSWELIPGRGHTPPGFDGAPVGLGVIGPMARTAEDLDIALDVLAGPDEMDAVGYKLDLMPAPVKAWKDWRVLVLDRHPLAKADREVVGAVQRIAAEIERAGAKVERESNRLPDLEAQHGVYMTLLRTIMSRGAPPDNVFGPPIDAHAWMGALDGQIAFRRRWAALFEDYDVVLAPVFGVVAFPHDDKPFNERTHVIDGEVTPYMDQIAWPGMATLANLPATAVPVGKTRAGLPIGMQVIGPYLGDKTTIAFAGKIQRELAR